MNTETKMDHAEAVMVAHNAKPLRMSEVTSFATILDYHGEWVFGETTRESWLMDDGNRVSAFCTVDLSQLGGPKHRNIVVSPKDGVYGRLDVLGIDDTLSWKIIGHKATGWALVILEHSAIIGSRWVAYIDPTTIPAAP